MGNNPQWGRAIIPSIWLSAHDREPMAVLPCESRLVATEWWAAAGIAPYAPQPLPPALSRPAYLARGAAPLPPHGRHRRIAAAGDLADFLDA